MKGDSFVIDLGCSVSQAHYKKISKNELEKTLRQGIKSNHYSFIF